MTKDRAEGALLGLAVGDALGTTYEFAQIEQPHYPTLADSPAVDVVGGGPFDLEVGAVTDDTQLAVCLARSLAANDRLDVDDLAKRFVTWGEYAFDVGNQTRAALSALERGVAPMAAGLLVWRQSERRPAGNGSLMRTAPLAVAYAHRPLEALVDAALRESMITHADPRCALACACFDAAIAANMVSDTSSGSQMLAAARDVLPRATGMLAALWTDADDADREAIARGAEAIAADLEAATSDNPRVYGEDGLHVDRTAGFVRVAFRIAFWHLVHTPSWRAALVDVASRGGDADTNAAITGALLGARDGASAIPAAWRESVLAAGLPGPVDWAAAHHPRHLLALAGRFQG